MHRLSTSFVLGYHGCDQTVADELLSGTPFKPSDNDYDWLGPGIYFWEANPQRGLDFAIESSSRRGSSIKRPAVIGAVLDLGLCLDMTTLGSIQVVKAVYDRLALDAEVLEATLPRNSKDLMRRSLDCAVIRRLHSIIADNGHMSLDSVRGIFIEGGPLYPTAGFYEKTHIQIAIANPACIKGVFRVPEDQLRRWSPV